MSRTHLERRNKVKAQQFLKNFAECGVVTEACKAANIPRATVYAMRERNGAFAKSWEQAEELGMQLVLDALKRDAINGLQRPIYQKGALVGHETIIDNRAREFLVSRSRFTREEWGDRSRFDLNLNVNIGARIEAAERRLEAEQKRRQIERQPVTIEQGEQG